MNCLNICDKTDFWKSHIDSGNHRTYLISGPKYNPSDVYNGKCNKLQRNIYDIIKNIQLENNTLIIKLYNKNGLFPNCNDTGLNLIFKLKSKLVENINDLVNVYFNYDKVSISFAKI